jgi:hypothetical protein
VGPAAWNQEVEGWRTWALSKEALALEGVGLREVELQRGAHPNYYYLTTWWDDLSRAEAAALPAGALAGREGLETLIQQAQGRRLLLLIDGRVVLALGEVEEARGGEADDAPAARGGGATAPDGAADRGAPGGAAAPVRAGRHPLGDALSTRFFTCGILPLEGAAVYRPGHHAEGHVFLKSNPFRRSQDV